MWLAEFVTDITAKRECHCLSICWARCQAVEHTTLPAPPGAKDELNRHKTSRNMSREREILPADGKPRPPQAAPCSSGRPVPCAPPGDGGNPGGAGGTLETLSITRIRAPGRQAFADQARRDRQSRR